ncbi:CaiB/BaiF CoA-transferase family protein [uncultured Intestinimonas sp.]|uniref:CaiB/BaiF CoA transferase family protein n=1 Tax=uncultured Intestinimonas sp. TaxID=1689265 RepID=UPI0025CECF64|nr:CaiB/BaiF CoA-transferase family protein [uncultured Intestinimonas sp.]
MNALEGIRVIDLSTSYSAPIATMQLADFGAEVIKIENVKAGDGSRSWNPCINGQSIHFLYMNRNKKSVALNLKSEEGKKILFELVKGADIVVENYRPGVTKKLGIDYEALRAVKPDIIMASLSGYGQTGPYAHRGAYSNLAEAQSGLMYITGWPAPEGKPTASGVAFGDSVAGMFLVQGIMYALYYREKTGKGQYIDVSMVDSLVALLQHCFVQYSLLGQEPERIGDRDLSDYPYDLFEAKDGYCQLGNSTPTDWSRFAEAIGRPDLGEDPAYKTSVQRWERINELHDIVQDWASKHTRKEIETIFSEYGQLYAPVLKISEVLEDEQILFREMVVDMEYEGMGKYKDKGIPVKMSETPGQIRMMPPHLGEHTDEILAGLGYTAEQIGALRAEGTVR